MLKFRLSTLLIVLLVFLGSVLLSACQTAATQAPMPIPPSATDVQLSSEVVVIDPAQTTIVQVSPDTNQVVVSGNTQPIQEGQIIASAPSSTAPYGFLKRVVNKNEQNGETVLQTEDASLAEAIVQGTLETQQAISPADIQIETGINGVSLLTNQGTPKMAMQKNVAGVSATRDWVTVRFDNAVLFDLDKNLSTTSDQVRANGTYSLLPDVGLSLSFAGGKLKSGKASLVVDQDLDLAIEVQVPKFTAEVELAKLKMLPFVVMVGVLPVVVHFEIPIVVGVGYDSADSIVMEFKNASNINGGLKLVDPAQGWSPYSSSGSTFSRSPFRFGNNAKVSLSAGAQFNVILYGLGGPKFEVKANFEIEQTPGRPCPKVYKQLLFEAGIKTVKLFDTFAVGTTLFPISLTERELMDNPPECDALPPTVTPTMVPPTITPVPPTTTPLPAFGSISGTVTPPVGGGTLPDSARVFAHNLDTGAFYWIDVPVIQNYYYEYVLFGLPAGTYQIVIWFHQANGFGPMGLVKCSFWESNCEHSNELKTIQLRENENLTLPDIVDFWEQSFGGDMSAWNAEPLP